MDTRITSLHPQMISRHLGGAKDAARRQEVGRCLISSGRGGGVGGGGSGPVIN